MNTKWELDLHVDGPNDRAFFKLSCSVVLKNDVLGHDEYQRDKKRGKKRGKRGSQAVHMRGLFLFIHPESIQSIEYGAENPGPGMNRSKFLRFTMTEPPHLVGPRSGEVTWENTRETSHDLLAAMIALANVKCFTVYLGLLGLRFKAHDHLPNLPKIFPSKQLKTETTRADLRSLYGGRGGVWLDLKNENPAHCNSNSNSDSSYTVEGAPPPYDEAETSHHDSQPLAELGMYRTP